MSSIIKQSHLMYHDANPVKVSSMINLEIAKQPDSTLSAKDDVEKMLEDKMTMLSKSIEEAESNYEKIVAETNEAILKANEEIESIKNSAAEEGANEGFSQGMAKANSEFEIMKKGLTDEIASERMNLENEKKEFMKLAKVKITEIFKEAFTKVFNKEVRAGNDLLSVLILKGLGELSDEKEVRIILAEEDYKNFDKDKFLQSIKANYSDRDITLTFDKKLEPASCLIETSLGFIDAGLNNLSECVATLIDQNIIEE